MKKSLLILLIIGAVVGVAFLLHERSVSESVSTGKSNPSPVRPVPMPLPAAQTATSDTNSAATKVSPVTNSAPSTNAVANTNTATAPVPPASSTPVVYYQDNFTRRGDLEGSVPDVKATGDNTWTLTTDQNSYTKANGGVTDTYNGYDAAYLPVNGTSGVPIDGKQNVVLSATITPDDSGHWMGIGLNSGQFLVNQGHNIFTGGPAALTIASGHAEAFHDSTQIKGIVMPPSSGKAFVISLTYRAANHTITYAIDGQPMTTLPDIQPDRMAALTGVSMGNGASGPTAKINKFTLTVGGTD